MIGQQLLVVSCMFIVARISSLDVDVDAGNETIFGNPDGMQNFFNTGLLGALSIVRIVGSVTWQLAVASAFPIAFFIQPVGLCLSRCVSVVGGYWYLQRGMGSRCDSQENFWSSIWVLGTFTNSSALLRVHPRPSVEAPYISQSGRHGLHRFHS
jgi:hypothetical protein